MRVVAGEFRGRRLVAPDGVTTRPTTDRVREAVFNSLVSMNLLAGSHVVDVFAGSGALGIEALSRGAQRCTFIERDRRALDALRANLEALGLSGRSVVLAADATVALRSAQPASVVFADPPYSFDDWATLLESVPGGFVVAETGGRIVDIDGWVVARQKRYGRTWVSFLEREEAEVLDLVNILPGAVATGQPLGEVPVDRAVVTGSERPTPQPPPAVVVDELR